MSDDEARAPASLWEVGFEYLVDSMRTQATYTDRAHAAQTALMFFTAAQSRALLDLGALVAEQRKANVIAAFEARVIKDDAEYIQARETVRAVLGLDTNSTGRPE
ncbi:hypothetical protein [Nocardia sp.]|uniref:hypothetical protein n=1 Tax=Nocardia sp. TaxID=1821 RepID=UPI00261C25A0|nr:hypothetical protein [Nocardia sp.]